MAAPPRPPRSSPPPSPPASASGGAPVGHAADGADPARATQTGPWRPERLLAVGGTARLYLASRTAPRGDATAVLKVPRKTRDLSRCAAEARRLAAAEHPHVVRLLGADPEGYWLATEHCVGERVDRWASGRSVDEVLRVFIELSGALQHLHARGMVHGDLKPEHVLIDDWGHPKLLDLEPTLGRGTPGFTAPEVLRGERATEAADYYGFAATLYAALTGRPPHDAPDPAAVVFLASSALPVPPSAWRTDLPGRLDSLVLQMLARHPIRRAGWREVMPQLLKLHRSPPSRPVVGMIDARRQLHRAIARAVDGQPGVVVLHGPPGSGRRTLVAEALRTARVEGLRALDDAQDTDTILEAARRGRRPVVTRRADDPAAVELTTTLLREGLAALVLLVASAPSAPLAQAGARHLTPPPLTREEALRIGHWLRVPEPLAEGAWRASQGLPRALWLRLRPHAQAHVSDDAFAVPRSGRAILRALDAQHGAQSLERLSKATGIAPHDVVDLVVLLEAAGLVRVASDGRAVRRVEGAGDNA
jgi:hypothetical protein